jgi:hypothetical protein
MVKSLVTFAWLRDLVIILLLFAGNHVRHASPAVGSTIIVCAAVVLIERFLWSWYVCDLKELAKQEVK